MNKITSLLIFLALIIQSPDLLAQNSLKGDWEGAIDIQGTKLTIITHFESTENGIEGTIDIPQQGGQDIPLQNISLSHQDSVQFEFMAGLGMASFEGSIQGDKITGTFHQNNQTFPFELHRQQQQTDKPKQPSPKTKPYHHKELTIKNDSVTIGGTLTWPKNTKSNHLVIMISGSGQQDRDETMTPVSNFKPFAVLADSLTKNKIATFRYDDRGVGESTGNFGTTTLDMLASDLEVIIEEITAIPDHNFKQITLLGHSQGGLVAGKLATENPAIDNIILMASTGVPLKEVLRFQVKQAFAGSGIDSVLIEQELAAREQLMQAIRNQQGIPKAKETYQKQFADIQLAAGADSTQAENLADRQTDQLLDAFSSPQMQSLLFYDPTDDLQKLNIPVLVLFGDKDTQVPVETNREPIKQALETAGVDYEIKVFKDANHLFQKANTGSMQEYGSLKKQFVDGFTSAISDWIKNKQY